MAAIDLTTVDSVRQFMQFRDADTEQDPIIPSLVTAASRAIMRDCQREFKTGVADGTAREFEYKGDGFLDLGPFDLRALADPGVEVDSDGDSPTTITTDQYRLYPFPNAEGVFTALRLDVSWQGSFNRWPVRRVRVTGDWGWPSVPDEVETACIITVATWLRRDVSAFSTTFSIPEDRLERPEAIPSAARALLAPFRRMVPY